MLADVKTTQKLLQGMGARVLTDNISEFEINGGTVNNTCAPYELVKTMRASILVLGPTLARFGEAQVSLPGGCAIGSRPVDQHLKGLETMGAEITIEHGYVKAKGRLKGTRVTMDVVTVGGTENLLMAATLAEGTTILENCAIEPESSIGRMPRQNGRKNQRHRYSNHDHRRCKRAARLRTQRRSRPYRSRYPSSAPSP